MTQRISYAVTILFTLLCVSLPAIASAQTLGTVGTLDSVGSDGTVYGWAADPNSSSVPIYVNIYIDAPYDQGGTYVLTLTTNQSRPDVTNATGYQGNHGFTGVIPSNYLSQAHGVYAYGISATGGANSLLAGSPKVYSPPSSSTTSSGLPVTTGGSSGSTNTTSGSGSGSGSTSGTSGSSGSATTNCNITDSSGRTTQMACSSGATQTTTVTPAVAPIHVIVPSNTSSDAGNGLPITTAGPTPTPTVGSGDTCKITQGLGYGARGTSVSSLQEFLSTQGYLATDSVTGFYGRLTTAAVQKYQADNNIVSSGSADTTGFGAVGPRTLAAIASDGCSTDASGSGTGSNTTSGTGSGTTATGFTITSPADYQVYQRNASNNATVIVKGSLAAGGATVNIVAKDANGNIVGQGSAQASGSAYTASFTLPAGGWYSVSVQELSSSGSVVASGGVAHVGVGEVFVIAGQSQGSNGGEPTGFVGSQNIVAFNPWTGVWQLSREPLPVVEGTWGSTWPSFQQMLNDRLHVPVAVVALNCAGSAISLWDPNAASAPWNCVGPQTGNLYARLFYTANVLNQVGGFRAVLWTQGEADVSAAMQNASYTSDTYYNALYKIMYQLNADTKPKTASGIWTWIVSKETFVPSVYNGPNAACVSTYASPSASATLAAAFKKIWSTGLALEGPDNDYWIGETYRWHDSTNVGQCVHLNKAGEAMVSQGWYQSVMQAFFKDALGERDVYQFAMLSTGEHEYDTDAFTPLQYGFVPMGNAFRVFTSQTGTATRGLYRCKVPGGMHFVSTDSGCEGKTLEVGYGYIYPAEASNSIALYRFTCSNGDHPVSTSSTVPTGCSLEDKLGYVPIY